MKFGRSISLKPMLVLEISLVVLLLGAGIAAATISRNTISVSPVVAPQQVTWTEDSVIEITGSEIELETSTTGASQGSVGTPIEMTPSVGGSANNATTAGEYIYK